MECYSIDRIMEMLSIDNPIEIQNRGIELAANTRFLSVFIMPIEDKGVWENCARIIANKSDTELQLYFFDLLEWLKDMNWPGAYIIYDRLLICNDETIKDAINYCLNIATQTGDIPWHQVLLDFCRDRVLVMK